MADRIKDGGPAYPVVFRMMTPQGMVGMEVAPGMSLRDAAALAALASWPVTDRNETPEGLARKCWALADAFVAAREAKNND